MSHYKSSFACIWLVILSACSNTTSTPANSASNKPIPIRIVIVTMFESGADTGDKAGEFQYWNERQHLTRIFKSPNMHHNIHVNEKTGVLGIVTGMGTANSSANIMALGLDKRFDLSKSYWLIAGISGFDPADASLGSVAWAKWLVDGDLAHEIDAREIPKSWDTGYFPLFSQGPYDPNKKTPLGEVYSLNGSLRDWAYQTTKDIHLVDHPSIAAIRSQYSQHPNAQRKPFVLKGDSISGMTFFHGELLTHWANQWMRYWTEGQGNFVSSAMEDTGTFLSLSYLHQTGLVDKNRVMVLRSASNFTMPPPGVSAAENLLREQHDSYAGLSAALENTYRVGSAIVDNILTNWEIYKNQIPGS